MCADVVIVVAVVILVGLFSMQHYGTDRVGWLFAPIVLLWFLLIGGIGIFNIWKYGHTVLRAFSPVYAYRYVKRGGKDAWTSLGGILLCVTGNFEKFSLHKTKSLFSDSSIFIELRCWLLNMIGTEALFADLAHFPVLAIQLAFTVVVFPCLLLAYTGQAAYIMVNRDHVVDAFYRSIPGLS